MGALSSAGPGRCGCGLAALACLAVMLAGCAGKTQPELQPIPQPPFIQFSWYNKTTGDHGNTGDHTSPDQSHLFPVGLDDGLVISLKARDNGGVNMISFSGDESWTCSDGTTHDHPFPPLSQTFHPSVQSIALPVVLITSQDWVCPSGSVAVGGSAHLDGDAAGYRGLQNREELFIDFAPKASP